MLVAFVLSLLAALPDALLALWLKLLGEGVARAPTRAWSRSRAIGARRVGHGDLVPAHGQHARAAPLPRQGDDRARVARRAAAGVDRDHRAPGAARYLDRLSMLRNQVFVLDHMYMSLFSTCGWILRLGVTIALLVSIHPALALLARVRPADRAHLDLAARRSSARAQERGASASRLARHLFDDRDDGAAGQGSARHRHRRAADRANAARRGNAGTGPSPRRAGAPRSGTRWPGRSSAPPMSARSCSSSSGLGASGRRRAAGAGRRLAPVVLHRRDGRRDRLPARHLDGRLASGWPGSRTTRRRSSPTADRPVPDRAARGHPLRARLVRLSGHRRGSCSTTSSLDLPAGAVVAIVGENGAGKTTLVKLLAKMYEPTRGRDPRRRTPTSRACRPASGARGWPARSRTSSASSSAPARPSASATCRASTTSRRSSTAVDRAGADDVIARLPPGLDTQLGPTWPDGVEVSFGQWQKLALARGFMRDDPLLLVLDEPTAALDAETEHALFERYAAAARERRRATAASPSSCRTASRRCAWPI